MPQATRTAWDIADRLHSAAIHLLRRARRSDPLTGASPAQLSALSVLIGGPKTLGELAAAEQVRAPTMSRLVAGMERAGLARKVRDRADARITRVHPTAKGINALRRGRVMRVEALAALVAALDRREQTNLSGAIAILERVLDARAAPWTEAARR